MAKEKGTGTAVTTRKTTALTDWRGAVGSAAKKNAAASAALVMQSQTVSFKGGVMTVGGVTNLEGALSCIVFCTMNEYAYYEGQFDGNNPKSPVCYAYGEDGELPIEPHDKSTKKQSDTCESCPNFEWGTAGEGRRGKACKQQLKLVLVPLSKNPSPDDVAKQLLIARVPATSLKNAKAYLDYLADGNSAPFAWKTMLECKPHPANVFTIRMTPDEEIKDKAMQAAILARLPAAEELLLSPYPEFEEQAKPVSAPAGRRKF